MTTTTTTTPHLAAPKPHTYTVVFPAAIDEKLSDDPTVLDAEIEALEARLIVLRAAKQRGPKQEYPKWVHKPVETKEHVPHPVSEKKIVHSKAEEDALGAGWHDPTDEAYQKKTAAQDAKAAKDAK